MGAEEAANVDGAISDLESKIIRQVEYYFGDYNLQKDRFLKEQMKENDGWIPMDTMIKFKRLKMLSEDYSVITSALKKSPTKLMEVSEDGTKIRRNPDKPVPNNTQEQKQEIDSRSVYVKGFKPDTTLDELLEFFKSYGSAENIYMRRRPTKIFKGSVFVTFTEKEEAQKFLHLKDVKFNGTVLLREMKMDYVKRKDEFYQEIKKEKEKKRKMQEDKKEDGNDQSIEVSENGIVKGCLLKLTGLSEGTLWENIKEVLSPHGTIAYVDYSKGKPQAIVRFDSAIAAEVQDKVSCEVDGVRTIKIKDSDAISTVLEGKEEIEYWKSIARSKAEMKQKNSQKGGWRSGNRGRFNQKNKRKHAKDEAGDKEGPPKKALKENSDA